MFFYLVTPRIYISYHTGIQKTLLLTLGKDDCNDHVLYKLLNFQYWEEHYNASIQRYYMYRPTRIGIGTKNFSMVSISHIHIHSRFVYPITIHTCFCEILVLSSFYHFVSVFVCQVISLQCVLPKGIICYCGVLVYHGKESYL